MAALLAGIAGGTLVSAEASASMMRHLEHQLYDSMLPRLLPIIVYPERVGLARSPVRIAHKTGSLSGARHDAGIVTACGDAGEERSMVICAFTDDLQDGELWTAENAGARTIAEIGRLAYEVLLRLMQGTGTAGSEGTARFTE
jgi:beta-lactamase class A